MEGNGVNNSTSPVSSDPKAANRARFELELEFVQALANPFYLHSLAQQNILEQPAFVNFCATCYILKKKTMPDLFSMHTCCLFMLLSNT
ncbi:hypothetical protein BJ912DRAFT_579244 [Pholiota molesta]|nr:hypothetical protein BJ912DRAFT_579244 [Pholiota molesta]